MTRPTRAGTGSGRDPFHLRGGAQLRIGDQERAEALQALGEHFAVGRLDREEYDERADAVLHARTAAEVAPLFADLPGPVPGIPAVGARDRGAPAGVRRPAAPAARHRPGRRLGVPFLPVLLLLLGFSALLDMGWLLLIGLAVWFLLPRCAAHASGSRRPSRGSWA